MFCQNCGAVIVNGADLIKSKDMEFDFFVPGKDEPDSTDTISVDYFVCPKCGYENIVGDE